MTNSDYLQTDTTDDGYPIYTLDLLTVLDPPIKLDFLMNFLCPNCECVMDVEEIYADFDSYISETCENCEAEVRFIMVKCK